MDGQIQAVCHVIGFPVTLYAICITLSIGAGLLFMNRLAARAAFSPDVRLVLMIGTLLLGFLGARTFYCLARLSFYMESGLGSMLQAWKGGYALWGAVGGVALAAVITAKVTRQSAARLFDVLAPPAALVIALCRFAEYFSGEGIGLDVEQALFQRFPFAVMNEYGEWYWAVFMLEALAALVILTVLMRTAGNDGDRARLFILLYASTQVVLESMRRDNFLRWLFVRVSQLTAVIVLACLMIGGIVLWIKGKAGKRMPAGQLIACCAGFILCAGACAALEFAIDKTSLPYWAAYLMMAAACVGLGACAYQVIFRSRGGSVVEAVPASLPKT